MAAFWGVESDREFDDTVAKGGRWAPVSAEIGVRLARRHAFKST
jgi:hypothetical protein